MLERCWREGRRREGDSICSWRLGRTNLLLRLRNLMMRIVSAMFCGGETGGMDGNVCTYNNSLLSCLSDSRRGTWHRNSRGRGMLAARLDFRLLDHRHRHWRAGADVLVRPYKYCTL